MLPVYCLHLPAVAIKKMVDAGFMYVEDLFVAENELHPDILKILKPNSELKDVLFDFLKPLKKVSLENKIQSEGKTSHILTFSLKLDSLFHGGIPLGHVIEVCGSPGSGKTQLCMQLCISVQLKSSLGGLEGEAIFIDSESGFSPQRISEIGEGCKEHCCRVAKANKFSTHLLETLENQSFSDYYHVSVLNYTQLLAIVCSLNSFIDEHTKVKLVVIDSLVFNFLQMNDMVKRTSLLCKILKQLKKLASNKNLSVVVTNHLTTRISQGEDQLIPALGECIGYLMNYRLMLGFLSSDNCFAGVIFKSPDFLSDSCQFQITKGGIRDLQQP